MHHFVNGGTCPLVRRSPLNADLVNEATVKEGAGAVTGNDSLKREGSAQQDKAESQREVAGEEAEAEKARAKAEARMATIA
jgi:uncharacterized protein YjbJ (UPF0337 family)